MKSKIIAIIVCIIALNLYFLPKDSKEENEYLIYPKVITINIDGEVVFPGTYTFYNEVSLGELINYAGGLKDNANESILRYDEVYLENRTVTIKELDEDINDDLIVKIDLNKATYQQLINIPNITEKRAANIIIYREEHGRFNSVLELMEVKNIKEATYEKIYKYFKV